MNYGDGPYLDIVFDGAPDHDMPRLIEVENPSGESVDAGEWIDQGDGTWVLRIPMPQWAHYQRGYVAPFGITPLPLDIDEAAYRRDGAQLMRRGVFYGEWTPDMGEQQ